MFKERVEKWHRDYKAQMESRRHKKAEAEECPYTFQPNLISKNRGEPSGSRFERLYKDAGHRETHLRELQIIAEVTAFEDARTNHSDLVSFDTRLSQEEIEDKILNKQLNYQRLREEKRLRNAQAVLEQTQKECPFKPQINPKSRQILEKSKPRPKTAEPEAPALNQAFSEIRTLVDRQRLQEFRRRQSQFVAKKEAKFASLTQSLSEAQGNFQPRTGRAPRPLSPETRREREKRLEQKVKESENGPKYSPYITPHSRKLWKAAKSSNESAKPLPLSHEEKEMLECTFMPAISEANSYVSQYRMGDAHLLKRIVSERQARLERGNQRKQEELEEEMKECTFSPNLNKPKALAEPVDISRIPGLDRFLGLKKSARQKERESKAHQAAVFFENPKNHQQLTETLPFKLRTSRCYNSYAHREAARQLTEVP